MVTKVLNKTIAYAAFCLLLTSISATRSIAREDYSKGRKGERLVEKTLLRELGLVEDVNDNGIIQLLDKPDKRRNAVILLIRYRRISSATPKLLQIFNDDKTNVFTKIAAANALCDFGNKEWMPTIKALSTDPNGFISRTPHKFDVAGLLARGGDYSQFEIVASGLSSNKQHIRGTAIQALGNFGHKTDTVTDSAAELLKSAATSDAVPWLRERAIESLEKIAKIKPEVESKVIAALEANKDSTDKDLRIMCNAKLNSYSKKMKKEKSQ
jgi:HEAT repeat protein